MEIALSQGLTILRSIVDSMDAAIYVLDRNYRIEPVNVRGLQWLANKDYPADSECYRVIHGSDHACENCPAMRTFESGRTERVELSLERGGRTRHYLLTTTPLRQDKDESFSHVVETVQDITAEKRAQEEVSRLSDFNTAIIDNAPVAIFTVDPAGALTSVNPALAAISGLGLDAESKLIGFNWLKNPYTIECGLADHIRRGLGGEPFELEDFRFITYRGDRSHYIDFKGVPLRGKGGEVQGLLCIIEETTHRVNEKKLLKEKNIALEEHLERVSGRDTLIGESGGLREVKRLIELVARSDTPVLILGETGTGKELVARAIHGASRRSKGSFVVINSSSLQEGMVESELFGYRKGAFTGADSDKLGLLKIAHGGTFFMDEVGDLDGSIQAKFLRVLETGVFRRLGDTREIEVDVRFVFATNKNLEDEVKEKNFRKDLFFRLNGFTIVVPPLRERREDIPLLADYFLEKLARGGRKKTLSPAVMDLLMGYPWPGNVRELANALERVVLVSGNRDEIRVEDLPQRMGEPPARIDAYTLSPSPRQVMELSHVEREHVWAVLQSVNGNKSEAARLLGISRRTLYRALNEPRTIPTDNKPKRRVL